MELEKKELSKPHVHKKGNANDIIQMFQGDRKFWVDEEGRFKLEGAVVDERVH